MSTGLEDLGESTPSDILDQDRLLFQRGLAVLGLDPFQEADGLDVLAAFLPLTTDANLVRVGYPVVGSLLLSS